MTSPADRAPERRTPIEGRRIELPAQRARQGATGHNVRYVLGISLAAVVIAFAVVYFIYFG